MVSFNIVFCFWINGVTLGYSFKFSRKNFPRCQQRGHFTEYAFVLAALVGLLPLNHDADKSIDRRFRSASCSKRFVNASLPL